MATGMIYNGYGSYETRDGERGIAMKYAGVEFWLPYQKVTYFPNYNFREVDHDKSTGTGGQMTGLKYRDVRVPGGWIVEEMTMKQVPRPNRDMGLLPIVGTKTGRTIRVKAGIDATDNTVVWDDNVAEVEPTAAEVAEADRLAKAYKEICISEYFQSKRQLMSGGKGQLQPSEQVRLFMEELGVKDLDDVENHTAIKGGFDPAVMAQAMALAIQLVKDRELEEATKP